ncbi:MAG: MFS transporter [Brevinematia bacterium]
MILEQEKRAIIRFIILMGVVSLFADMVYETARGVMGPYLGYLGANAFAIGLVFGIGEFLGYFLRIFAGAIIDRTRKYWSFVYIGYGAIASIPLLAFADYWLVAGTLIIMERIGKAIRSPAKDTIISIYSKNLGKGLTFGIHETADQLGAVAGPALFYLLLLGLGYKNSFLVLFIPFLLMVGAIIVAKNYSKKIAVEVSKEELSNNSRSNTSVYLYLAFIFLTSLGFIGFPILSFHAVKTKLISDTLIPLIYSLVMVLDALVAVPIGILYDKFGIKVMTFLPIAISITVAFGLSNNILLLVIALLLWGVIMSSYETVVRAYVGDNVSLAERGTFYGIFNTILGLSLALGNSIAGYIYEINKNLIIYLAILIEIIAMFLIIPLITRSGVRNK